MEKENIDIKGIFYEKLSSNYPRMLLIDLSVFPEEFGGEISGVLKISTAFENLESLKIAFVELQTFGLVGVTKNDEQSEETGLKENDRIWLKKGITKLIKKQILEED